MGLLLGGAVGSKFLSAFIKKCLIHFKICMPLSVSISRSAQGGLLTAGTACAGRQRALQAKMKKVGRGHMWWLVGCSGTLDNRHGNYNIIITINRSKININISKIQDQRVS